MAKMFVISDVHGFYDEMKNALDEVGFDPNNEEHWLVGCGDYLDRGRQPQEVIDYLNSLERKVLCFGNHESLMLSLLKRKYPMSHDWHNGTAQSVCDLAPNAETFDEACDITNKIILEFIKNMPHYFETKHYVFTHSWIPTKFNNETFSEEYDSRWRRAAKSRWEKSMWIDPFKMARKELFPKDKVIVFGHWATEKQWAEDEGRRPYYENPRFEPYIDDRFIGLDCTTVLSHKVGLVVLEDEFLEE